MVIDSSVIIAILGNEAEEPGFRHAIKVAPSRLVSAPTLVEIGIVALGRAGEAGLDSMRALLDAFRLDVVPLSSNHATLAIDAFRKFGKGRHPAGLNFGACFSYALAKATSEPLLFKGNDFNHTDIKQAAWSLYGDKA